MLEAAWCGPAPNDRLNPAARVDRKRKRTQLLLQDAQPAATSSYGQKYEIRAILIGPNGRSAEVASIWIVLAGEDAPRLVAAYPEVLREIPQA